VTYKKINFLIPLLKRIFRKRQVHLVEEKKCNDAFLLISNFKENNVFILKKKYYFFSTSTGKLFLKITQSKTKQNAFFSVVLLVAIF